MKLIVKTILFNYDTTNVVANIPINLRHNYDSDGCLDLPEYEVNKKKSNPVCYAFDMTNNSLKIKIKLEDTDHSLTDKISIMAEALDENILGNIDEKEVSFLNGYYSGDYSDFQLNNNRISEFKVGKFNCRWKWKYKTTTGSWQDFDITSHVVYIIPHKPLTSLWDLNKYDSKYIPWVNALDYICMALNETSATKTDDEIKDMVALLINGSVFEYDINKGACAYSDINVTRSSLEPGFNPVLFMKRLERANNRNKLKVNCNDCATINSFFLSLLGIENEISYLSNNTSFSKGFGCNQIKAIGYDNWAVPFEGGFKYHAVCSKDNTITDSCLQIDYGLTPFSSAEFAGVVKIGKVACRTPFSVPITGADYAFEDCYKERLCKPNALADCNIVSSTKKLIFKTNIPLYRMKNTSLINKDLKSVLKEKKSSKALCGIEDLKLSDKFEHLQKLSEENQPYLFYNILYRQTKKQYYCEFYFCEDFKYAIGCADSLIFSSVVVYKNIEELNDYLDVCFISATNSSIIGVKGNLTVRFSYDKSNNDNDNDIIEFSKRVLSDL